MASRPSYITTPDPLLERIPLQLNSKFLAPRPPAFKNQVSLPDPATVIPPKFNLSEQDLQKWRGNLNDLERRIDINEEEVNAYKEWLRNQQRKVAPGFDYSIMKPSVKSAPTSEADKER